MKGNELIASHVETSLEPVNVDNVKNADKEITPIEPEFGFHDDSPQPQSNQANTIEKQLSEMKIADDDKQLSVDSVTVQGASVIEKQDSATSANLSDSQSGTLKSKKHRSTVGDKYIPKYGRVAMGL